MKDISLLLIDLSIPCIDFIRYIKKIKETSCNLMKKEERFSMLKALNDTANGRQNEKGKIMLETYVQMAYLRPDIL